MSTVDPAIAYFVGLLEETIESGNASRLRGMLSGRELPALGGDLEPADVVHLALLESPEYTASAGRLGDLLAFVVRQEASSLKDSSQIQPRQRHLLLNILYLAAELPADEELFKALKELRPVLGTQGVDENIEELRLALWRALVHQQVDDSLEGEWLSFLSEREPWTVAHRTLLLTAWRGVLWVPPNPEKTENGKVVDFDRIEKALLALYGAVADREEESSLLRTALTILMETYPRSAEFWMENLQKRTRNWPPQLRDVALENWPDLNQMAESGPIDALRAKKGHQADKTSRKERKTQGHSESLIFNELGRAIRWLRDRQGKKQYQVADVAGITKAMLSEYERGKQKPSLDTLERILSALECDLIDLHNALQVVSANPEEIRRPRAAQGEDAWRAGRVNRNELVQEGVQEGGNVTVYRVLGLSRQLPPMEERALAEMIQGFHKFVRFLHLSNAPSVDESEPEEELS